MALALSIILFFLAGFAIAKLGFAKSEHYKALANIVFYICLPASLLVSFSAVGSLPPLPLHFAVLFASLIAIAIITYVASRALNLDTKTFYALLLCGSFGNVIYFGFPFTEALFGTDALSLAGLYVIAYNVFVFALLYPLISAKLNGKAGFRNGGLLREFLNPPVLFTIFGLASLVLGISLSPALPYLQAFASLTAPLSLLAMGLFLAEKFHVSFNTPLLSIVAAKTIALPLITAILLFAAGLWDSGKVMLLLSFMPVALSNFAIVESLKLGKEKLVTDAIVVTSIISTLLVIGLRLAGVL